MNHEQKQIEIFKEKKRIIFEFNLNRGKELKEIKQKAKDHKKEVKKGCGKEFIFYGNDVNCGEDFEYEEHIKVILCPADQKVIDKYEEVGI